MITGNKCKVCMKNNQFISDNLLFNRAKLELDFLEFKQEICLGMIIIKDRTFLIEKMTHDYTAIKTKLEITLNNKLKELGIYLYQMKFDYVVIATQKTMKKVREYIENANKNKLFSENLILQMVCKKIDKNKTDLKSALLQLDHVFNYINSEKTYFNKNTFNNQEFNEIYELITHEKNVYYEIESALKENRVFLFTQGIGDKDKFIDKYECLVRMEVNGIIKSPDYFLKIAKKYNLYHEISKRVIELAFDFYKDKESYFSINLESSDFNNFCVLKMLVKNLKKYTKKKFIIEITETEEFLVKNLKTLNKLREKYNILVSIDDYGTGYSNLMNITQLNANFLKIDGSIIRDIHNLKNNQKILKNICDLAKSFDMKIVAEYVSNKEIKEFLDGYGIDFYQGYYIDIPKKIGKE